MIHDQSEMTVEDVLDALDGLRDGSVDTVPVEALRRISNGHKPGGAEYDETTSKLEALVEDGPAARQLVTDYLNKAGLGYDKTRDQPIMASGLLAWIVSRIAGLLDTAPTYRWRLPTGDFEADDTTAHKAASAIVEDMDLTSAMRKLHKIAVVSGQAYLRIYSADEGLQPRVFGANVLRLPHPALADRVQHDRLIALPLSGGMLEVHWQDDNERLMVWCDAETGIVDRHTPRASVGHATGYEMLPIVRLSSEPTVGAPYVSPRSSRVTYTLKISGLMNDLDAMSALEAHAILLWLQDLANPDREDAHAQTPKVGPGQGFKLPKGDTMDYLQANPKIAEVAQVVQTFIRVWMMGEQVPQHEAKGDAALTGQALLVAERGLAALSEAMRPMLVRATRDVWRVATDVAATDGDENLPTLDLALQIAPQRTPATMREILEDLAKSMALDLSSRVDGTMRITGCNREDAIELLKQIDADLAEYGRGSAREMANREGGGFTENLNAEGGETFDSTADAVRRRTAGEARADRREGEAA